jgi:hypothetical protein
MKNEWFVGVLLICGLAAGCTTAESGRGESSSSASPRFSHPRQITNPYLPLASLKQDILESKTSRIERTARPEIHKTFEVSRQTVDSLAVEDREFENGELTEVTLDYFAQADDGTVYYLGEDVNEYRNGKIVGHSGAWLAGKDTRHPGVIMPARPAIGDKFRSEDVPKITWEKDEIISISESAVVPAGSFQDCIKIREKASDGATEYKLYAPGVGCIKEIEGHDEAVLRSHDISAR